MNDKAPSAEGRQSVWTQRAFGRFILLSDEDYALLRALWPRCVVCDRPVDGIEHEVHADGITFTARCHGAEETTKLTAAQLRVLLAKGVQGGEAFAAPALPAAPRALPHA